MVSEEGQIEVAQGERAVTASRETLVCRSWFKVKKQVFNANYEYEITAVEREMITLSNAMTLPISLIYEELSA